VSIRGLLVIAMRHLTFFALVQTLVSGFAFGETARGQHPEEFRGTVTRSVQMKYLLFIPDGYGDDQSRKWPLILYLHGGSRRGDEIEKPQIEDEDDDEYENDFLISHRPAGQGHGDIRQRTIQLAPVWFEPFD
jgi:hypothetical protein